MNLIHAGDVDAGVLLDGVNHGDALERSLEADNIVADLHFSGAVHIKTDAFKHLLGEVHHPVIVLVGYIDLHAGELGIVSAVHTLVAEILGELIYPFETAHDKTLQIKLIGDAEIQGDVKRIVMGDERTCGSSSGNRLKDGSLNLHVAMLVEISAH